MAHRPPDAVMGLGLPLHMLRSCPTRAERTTTRGPKCVLEYTPGIWEGSARHGNNVPGPPNHQRIQTSFGYCHVVCCKCCTRWHTDPRRRHGSRSATANAQVVSHSGLTDDHPGTESRSGVHARQGVCEGAARHANNVPGPGLTDDHPSMSPDRA